MIKSMNGPHPDPVHKAICFAAGKYSLQMKTDTGNFHVFQPLYVGKLLSSVSCSHDVIVAGILHDILDVTATGQNELREEFGEKVLDLVLSVNGANHNLNPVENMHRILQLAEHCSLEILLLLCAVHYGTISQLAFDIGIKGEKAWDHLTAGKDDLSGYYIALADIFLIRLTHDAELLLAEKFRNHVMDVFWI